MITAAVDAGVPVGRGCRPLVRPSPPDQRPAAAARPRRVCRRVGRGPDHSGRSRFLNRSRRDHRVPTTKPHRLPAAACGFCRAKLRPGRSPCDGIFSLSAPRGKGSRGRRYGSSRSAALLSERRDMRREASYAPPLPTRRERTMLRRIRNALACSASVKPASILTSTDRTATVAFSRLPRPRGVSRVPPAPNRSTPSPTR